MSDEGGPPSARRRGDDPRRRALYRELLARLARLPDAPRRREALAPGHAERPIGRAGRALAQALADAFLAGAWTQEELRARGAHVVGDRRPWLRAVAHAVTAAYRDPPADRPRELGRFVAAHPVYRAILDAARERGPIPRVVGRLAAPTTTVRRRWPVPRLDDLADLAAFLELSPDDLEWFADRRTLTRRMTDARLMHYRHEWRPTRGGGVRLLEAPKFRLKTVQRRVLSEVVALIPQHPASHGFRPGRSVVSYSAPHAGRAVVIRLDLEGFFATVGVGRVYGVFRTAGYPEPVAHSLAGLVTTVAPIRVLSAAPRPADAARLGPHHRLLQRLRAPHLPQGAPTSPALAGLSAFRLDQRLAGLAEAFAATYTRYADDLAFSTDRPATAATLIDMVKRIAREEGFRVHPAKTSVRGRGDRQLLGGLVVNARPAVPRNSYDELRAILHNAASTGPQEQNRCGHPDFRAHLLGRIAWVAQSHPARGARLRAAYDRIVW